MRFNGRLEKLPDVSLQSELKTLVFIIVCIVLDYHGPRVKETFGDTQAYDIIVTCDVKQ